MIRGGKNAEKKEREKENVRTNETEQIAGTGTREMKMLEKTSDRKMCTEGKMNIAQLAVGKRVGIMGENN